MRDNRTVLQHELDKVQAQIAELEKTFAERPDFGLGTGSPAAARREIDRALLQRLKRRSESIRQALSRLGQGSYGVCVQCGKPIHPERLLALPDAKSCIDCARGIWSNRE